MEKFMVMISQPDSINTINVMMEPSANVMDVAEKLSIAYPGSTVSVEMFARIRRSYEDGTVISSTPDLSKFYTGVDEQDQWSWSCYGQVTD